MEKGDAIADNGYRTIGELVVVRVEVNGFCMDINLSTNRLQWVVDGGGGGGVAIDSEGKSDLFIYFWVFKFLIELVSRIWLNKWSHVDIIKRENR